MLVLVPPEEDTRKESRTMTAATITTGIREEVTTRVTMELRMLNKECREWASAAEETATATITATRPRPTVAVAVPYPNQTNITSSRRKLPKR